MILILSSKSTHLIIFLRTVQNSNKTLIIRQREGSTKVVVSGDQNNGGYHDKWRLK